MVATGSLLALTGLPLSQTFAADPPHLVAYGPSGSLSVGANAAITAQVVGATGTPMYQFRINNRIVQRYSTNSRLVLNHLSAGRYTITVRSLGMAQDKRGDWGAFRSSQLYFTVGSPHLTATGTTKNGTETVTAQVVDAVSTPYYQFVIDGKVVQAYSTKNTYTTTNLKPGSYQVEVESLGPAQYRNHEYYAARTQTLTLTVPTPAAAPHLTVTGPTNNVATNGTATITAQVVGATTTTPYYQFEINGTVVQAFSTTNTYTATNLKPGSYQVKVEALGPAQYQKGQYGLARTQTLTLTVPTPTVAPHLTVTGPTNNVATNGTATITAQVVDATTTTPYYQFEINGTVVQAFSTKNTYTATNLKPGSYQVKVEALGPAQYQKGQYGLARTQTLTLTVPTPAVPPKVVAANADVGTGISDTLTLSGVTSSAPVTWSVVSSNSSTGLISGTTDSATFVATAPGTYTIQADADGETATAKVVVYGEASGVTLAPASSTVIADGEATDAIVVNVVDQYGNPVGDFNGSVNLSTVSGVSYSQNGTTLTPVNGEVSVVVTDGTATINVGQVSVPGLSIPMTSSALASTNGQTVAAQPTYASTSITSAPQVATSLKIVNAPTYLDANSQGTETSPISVEVEDQAGYPMLSGTESMAVNVSGPATLVGSTNNQETLAYYGASTPAGSTNTSASFELASEQGQTGPVTITATSPGLASASATVQAVIAGVPTKIAASLSANQFAEGSRGITLHLQAEDSQGAPVNYTSPVSIVVTKQGSTTPAGNILVNGQSDTSSTEISFNGNGSAAVTLADDAQGANAGTYSVSIEPVAGAQYSFPAQTLTFTETAAALAGAAFTSPSNTITVPITQPTAQYTLQLQDSYGNAIHQAGVKVEIYAVGSSSNGSPYGQATVNGTETTASTPVTVTTNSNGQATVTLAAEGFQNAQWVLYATVPQQAGVTSTLQSAPSAAMQVSAQVANSLSVGLQDESAGPDYQSTGYAQAGNTVDATITVKNQYGAPMVGSQTVQLTIPAGLSGMEPQGANDSASWTPGSSNTVTMTLNLNGNGTATVPLEAWSEGSATLQASVPGVSSPVSGQAAMFVQAGAATNVGLFQNGVLISGANKLTVNANSPVAVTVESTDLAQNPVPAAGQDVVDLSDNNGGSFRLTPTGAPITEVTIPAGQTSQTIYYVNGTQGSYVPSASLAAYRLSVVGPSSYTVNPGTSQTITAMVYDSNSNPVVGQTVTASVPNNEGTVTPSTVSGSNGQVSFTYTAPASGSGTATVTLTLPVEGASGSSLTQTVTITY